MTLLVLLRIGGALLLVLAASHALFPKRLGWREDLARLTPLNRQVFLVHTFFIVLVVSMMGILSLAFADLLVAPSPLARFVLAGLTLFWAARLFVQWFVYDASLWRGDRFNTTVHVAFSILWTYLTAVYGAALWIQLR
ncbi:MAG TPA: hypothetical protein VGR00_11900 [Thermoanaerobaculia bacterium]|nr:hypothetical protein [Thermoanaerobaculia bacterium]